MIILESLKQLFRVGNGPSSSHTMGPRKAAEIFYDRNKEAARFTAELYGALALTGQGHLTDIAIKTVLGAEKATVVFHPEICYDYHPNGMKFFAYDAYGQKTDEWLVFSVGGGDLRNHNEPRPKENACYAHEKMQDILKYTEERNMSLLHYIIEAEGKDIIGFSEEMAHEMFAAVQRGFEAAGTLPGPLNIKRRAGKIYEKYRAGFDFNTLVFAAALAVSEENAAGGLVVTAPTCGSSGVMPGILYGFRHARQIPFTVIREGLLVGGLVGNLVKHNASIAGAEVGCQGEVGTACAIGAAAVAYMEGGSNEQIEYAAEIALEHHLGMICDPVLGLVQIPCIERNALAAQRAIDSAAFALLTDGKHYISLDECILSLKETGRDLHPRYRETALGGLAKRNINYD